MNDIYSIRDAIEEMSYLMLRFEFYHFLVCRASEYTKFHTYMCHAVSYLSNLIIGIDFKKELQR